MKALVFLSAVLFICFNSFSQTISKGLPNEDKFTEIGFVKQMGTGVG